MNIPDLASLPTEAINPATKELSRLPTLEAMKLMNDEDQKVAVAVREVLPEVAQAIEKIAPRLQNGGHLFYIGAGTSGRLGVVDASECPPTFGVEPELVQGLIAGGPKAIFNAQEGAEDVYADGERDLKAAGFAPGDALVGLAASGRTPYVIGALDYARSLGAFTAAVTVNPQAVMKEHCEVFIAPFVGAEVVTGSTRLKSGTAQKLILNMISTGVMLRLGKVDGNLMTHLRPSCEKLVDRSRRLVMGMTGVSVEVAEAALARANGEVAVAVEALKQENLKQSV